MVGRSEMIAEDAVSEAGQTGVGHAETSAPPPPKARVLVVDDEQAIVEAVAYNLRLHGHDPIMAGDADTALRLLREKEPELVILDIMLPSGSGFDICRLIRQTGNNIPILMLTARFTEADRVYGLEIGADDYLVKPFGMRELMARVQALLRRSVLSSPVADGPSGGSLIVSSGSGLTIDSERREVRLRNTLLNLSRKEFDLLALLASHPGRVFDRQTLLDRVWGEDAYVDDRTVDVHIRWLREKVEPLPGKPQFLLTVRGVGYKFQG
ncbi:MAG: response regulator transcription factor [Capsulimonadales bacterium]|nr:response regulator transcription factor [Capsulimonadales bacterium]